MSRRNNYFIPATTDSDALAFFSAAGITDSTQKAAVDTMVKSLKSNSLWTKLRAIYPFVGGSATSHKFNLKDPRDLDAAFRLTFSGGWVHSSTGAKGNGTTGYANTFLNENTTCNLNDIHISYYSRTDVSGTYFDIGNYNGVNSGTNISIRRSDGRYYPQIQVDSGGTTFAVSNSLGFYIGNRVSATSTRNQVNSIIKIDPSTNTVSKISTNFFINALSVSGLPSYYSPRECAFATIGDGLTDQNMQDFYTIVQAYQTSLGRNV